MRDPTFPGEEAALQQLKALMRPDAPRPPLDDFVQVEFIVEPTGQVTFPHVVYGLGLGYDEEAVRVVRLLPPFGSAIGRERQPMAVVWHADVRLRTSAHRQTDATRWQAVACQLGQASESRREHNANFFQQPAHSG